MLPSSNADITLFLYVHLNTCICEVIGSVRIRANFSTQHINSVSLFLQIIDIHGNGNEKVAKTQ